LVKRDRIPKPPLFRHLCGTGTTNHITKWLTSTSIGDSAIFEGGGLNIGIGTTTPAAKLDVKGTGAFRSTLSLFPSGTNPTLSVSGTAFEISSTGKVTFVAGQTYPGAGTVKTVNSGLGLIGGPIHGTGTLSINTSVVPLLGAANVFTANQAINGNLSVSGNLGSVVSLDGSVPALIGSAENPTSGASGNSLTVTGGGAAAGATDAAGGDLVLAAGDGTGVGGSGAVGIQTASPGSTGTTADTLVDRQIYLPKTAPMGGQDGFQNMFLLNIANGDAAGAIVRFTIRANDGGNNFVAATGSCTISAAVASNGLGALGRIVFSADYDDPFNLVNAYCYSFSGGINMWGIGIGDHLTFAPTIHDIYFEIDNISGSALSNLPVTPSATATVVPDIRTRVDSSHRRSDIRRTR
jgi:hypothetical protein